MSSSRIFKEDLLFTPKPLVQHENGVPGGTAQTPGNGVSPSLSPDAPTQHKAGIERPRQAPSVDLEAIKKAAYKQGAEDQVLQYHDQFQQATAAFAEACQKIDGQRKRLLEQSRGDIINLIIALSTKILGQELSTPRNSIATTLQMAIEQAIESEEYYVTLHPDDLAFAEAKVPELIASIRGLERIVCKTDKNVTRGGCLLESTACSVDATIETQLESMKEFLEEQSAILPIPETE